jgi:uncharacterized delta-60 repeat protein
MRSFIFVWCRKMRGIALLGLGNLLAASLAWAVQGTGNGVIIGSDVPGANGKIYDYVLMTGAAVTVAPDVGQVARVIFVDPDDDLVYVDYSGAGSMSIVLDNPTGPADLAKYNLSGSFWKGRARITIQGHNATSSVTVSAVGSLTPSVSRSIFRNDVTYDGVADISSIQVVSIGASQFGSLQAGNARFSAAAGIAGISASNVTFVGPVLVGDIDATSDPAALPSPTSGVPALILGAATDVRIFGGDLAQSNGANLRVSGFTELAFAATSNAFGVNMPAQSNLGVLQNVAVPGQPVFTSANAASIFVGSTLNFTVKASATGAPTFSIAAGTLPAWASLDPTTGVISGTPPHTIGSPFVFTVRASNGSAAATQTFKLSAIPSPTASNVVLAISGDPAPDGNGQVAIPQFFALSEGAAAFAATTDGSVGGSADDWILANATREGFHTIFREGANAPASGQFSTSLGNIAVNPSGEVAFHGILSNTSQGTLDNEGIFSGTGSSITQIARANQPEPAGGPGNFNSFGTPRINTAGQVVFWGAIRDAGTPLIDTHGIFVGSGGALTQIARTYMAAPGGGTFTGLDSGPNINANGEVAFYGSTTSGNGIFRGNGTTTVAIARVGQAPPEGNGTLGDINWPYMNANGQVAFYTTVNGSSGGTLDGWAIYRGSGGSLTKIVRSGDAAPGSGQFEYFDNTLSVNGQGDVAFAATRRNFTGHPELIVPGLYESVYWGNGTEIKTIARTGDPTPEGGSVFTGFILAAINDTRTVAFQANLSLGPDYRGIYLGDGTETMLVARVGDQVLGSTIVSLGFDPKAYNAFKEIAYQAILADGRWGVLIFSPKLKWRQNGDGTWDDPTRWTVSLRPAGYAITEIDPATGGLVTGPEVETTLRSLKVGGTTTGTVELNLKPAGPIKVVESATIASHGKVSGVGVIKGKVINDGTVSPGNSPGLLKIEGDFTQSAGGQSIFQIGGTDPALSDQLWVTGAVDLAGTVKIELIDGFVPTVPITVAVIRAQSVHWNNPIFQGPAGYTLSTAITNTDTDQLLLVTLTPPLSIATPPQTTTTTAGQSVTLNVVTAGGTGTLNYQWRRNGIPISGATGASYSIATPTMLDAGNYDVVVSDGSGSSVTSSAGVLSVAPTQYPRVMKLDTTFAPLIEATGGTVYTSARQPDGKLLVGGLFTRINGVARRNLARLNADGSVDTGFNPGLGPDAAVDKIVLQPDGKVLFAGDFLHYGDAIRGRIARANADGSLDSTFVPGEGANASISSLGLQADGKVVIVGQFTTYDGVSRGHLARLNSNGSHDLTFDPGTGTSGIAMDATVLADGKILIVGSFSQYNGTPRAGVARVLTDGSVDPTFVPVTGSDFEAWTLALQPDGKILVGAMSFFSSAPNLLRLNADGSRDSGFNAISLRGVNAIVVQPDGGIVVGGPFGTYNGAPRSHVLRLTSTGAFDSTFNSGSPPDFQANTLVLLPDGRIVAGGRFMQVEGSARSALARLGTNGAVDATFAGDVRSPGTVEALIRQPDGKLLLGGEFDFINNVGRKRIARLTADGALDPTFTPAVTLANGVLGAVTGVSAFGVQPDGKILVGGFFDRINGVVRNRIARLQVDGSVDSTFDPGVGANSGVSTIALQPDGKILLGGLLNSYAGVARGSIARVDSTGALDLTFDPGAGANGTVFSIALQPDGKALIGGWFSTYGGVTRKGVARILASGSLDLGFGATNGSTISTQAFLTAPDGGIFVGGTSRVVRLNTDGSVDSGYDGANLADVGIIGAMLRQADGRLFVGQATNSSMNSPTVGIARLNVDGSRDNSFQVLGLRDAHFSSINLLENGSLLVAGSNFGDGRTNQAGLARFISVPTATIETAPADQSVFAGDSVALSVTASGDGPFTYQWLKDGVEISGATNATLSFSPLASGDAGHYSVAVSNPAGTTVSSAAMLTVLPAVPPVVTTQPRSQAVSEGSGFVLDVGVSGSPPLRYQWLLDGAPIDGATASTYAVAAAQPSSAGSYTVVVTNAASSATSDGAQITVIPAGFSATHAVVGFGYVPDSTVTITNTLTYAGTVSRLDWQVLLPTGWSFVADGGAVGDVHPVANQTDLLEWTWHTPPASPVTFTYTLNVPAGTSDRQEIAALMLPTQASVQSTMLVKPDPLSLFDVSRHTADTDRDGTIGLTELLRVIELYNTRNGTVRTGAYTVDPTNLEDGFATDPARSSAANVALPRYHSADTMGATAGTPPDGKISLGELLRVIELYNYRSGTLRTGQYHVQGDTEDGFAPGAGPLILSAVSGTSPDVLTGGAGDDILRANQGQDTLIGGGGTNTFVIPLPGENITVYSTIIDIKLGDKIQLKDQGSEVFSAFKVVFPPSAVFQDYANAVVGMGGDASANGAVGWFQYNGDTYIVESMHNGATTPSFANGIDIIVKLKGLVDLSHSTLQQTGTGAAEITIH